ncbi:ATP-binding cassette domain-containing protein [Peptoniphilus sp. GNH]|nr:ABC transporter, ATP-binding protein [Clostridiales bacterium KA00134]UHR03506.1 ATP-binding cassette domain-containing protein [Peptoniphilus sp. GNH]
MIDISIKDLNFGYTEDLVIRECNLEIEKGDLALILGGNGSGKSTLLKLILGELTPKTGKVEILGKEISTYKSYKAIGYVPQINIVNKIAFPITCLELVTLNLYEDFGLVKIPKKKHYEKARQMLIDMDMEKYINYPVNELSGGLQQRAMISRALINNPEILILDEPTAGVDKDNKEKFLEKINILNKEKKITVVMVTHELKEIENLLDVTKQYRIVDGRMSQC